VAGQRVTHLVADDRPHLLLVQQLHQAGGDHDQRIVHAMHIAFGCGSCVTYIAGTFSRSRM